MSTSSVAPGSKSIPCIACNHENDAAAKFCAGCGHGLYEPCSECGNPVLLNQKFCGSCGRDLASEVDQKRSQYEQWLAKAIEATKAHEYSEALALLRRVAENKDFRYQEFAKNAAKAIEKVTAIAEQNQNQIQQRIQRALAQEAEGDRAGVVETLRDIPAKLMPEDGTQLLARNQAYLEQLAGLRDELQSAVSMKDWALAGGLIDQLLELVPENKKYQSLSKQVAQKLISRATRRFERQEYRSAADQLSAVPKDNRGEEYDELHQRVSTVKWLSEQFSGEPYATPALGNLAMRFRKEVPHDGRASQRVETLAKRIQAGNSDPRFAAAIFGSSSASWLGGNASVFAIPQSLVIEDTKAIRKNPGRFGVAFGLALQGLGLAKVSQCFGVKKGLLSGLKSRSKTKCWGIDIGSSGIQAALLKKEKSDERPHVIAVHQIPFEAPINRGGTEAKAPMIIKSAVEKLLGEIEVEDASVYASFPSSSVVNRFVRLPPVKDKQVDSLLKQETEQQIPIPIDELDVVTWTLPENDDPVLGRPSLIAAAKKSLVQSRIDLLGSGGLTVDGLQNESIALLNFGYHEFETELAGDANESSKRPAVALVDAGAASTRLILFSRESFWYWTIDSGSEELTSVLARICRCTKQEAEQRKINPAVLERPAEMYEPVEIKLQTLRGRLESIVQEAQRQNESFEINQTWCFGGGCLPHSWLKRVLMNRTS